MFTELYQRGGIDTFIAAVINFWPSIDDSFVLVANSTYPGLEGIEERLSRPCEVVRYGGVSSPDLAHIGGVANTIRRIASPASRYVQIAIEAIKFRRLWKRIDADALIVVNGGYPGGDACRAAALSWGSLGGQRKSIHNFHNMAAPIPSYLWLQETLVDTLLSKVTYRFVTVSKAAASSISARPAINQANLTSYIYNGIAIGQRCATPTNVRKELGLAPSTPLCLMLGTYEARKGHHFLFRAFKRVLAAVPDAHLLVCGFGFPYEIEQVKLYRRELGLESRVHLHDFRPDASSLLEHADVLVIASQEYESFGLTSVEAMAHKVPVVATNIGGIPEVVVSGEGGYCVDSRDVDGYAACIIALLKDKKLRAAQGMLGYRRYREHFGAQVMATQYADLVSGMTAAQRLQGAD